MRDPLLPVDPLTGRRFDDVDPIPEQAAAEQRALDVPAPAPITPPAPDVAPTASRAADLANARVRVQRTQAAGMPHLDGVHFLKPQQVRTLLGDLEREVAMHDAVADHLDELVAQVRREQTSAERRLADLREHPAVVAALADPTPREDTTP